MTTKPNDGGAAFPSSGNDGGWSEDGISMRDFFAKEAMGSLIVLKGHSERIEAIAIAKYAYLMADAMLKEREAK